MSFFAPKTRWGKKQVMEERRAAFEDVSKVTTKNYLFASVTSTLILLFVLPTLRDPEWLPTQASTVIALSAISISLGGLAAAAYEIVKCKSKAFIATLAKSKRYFMSLTGSLFALVSVAPSIPLLVLSPDFIHIVDTMVLLCLSFALSGLTTECFFGLLLLGTTTPRKKKDTSQSNTPPDPTSALNKVGKARETTSSSQDPNDEQKVSSQDQIVDVLLGKTTKTGEN
jgi:hypothetical protein